MPYFEGKNSRRVYYNGTLDSYLRHRDADDPAGAERRQGARRERERAAAPLAPLPSNVHRPSGRPSGWLSGLYGENCDHKQED